MCQVFEKGNSSEYSHTKRKRHIYFTGFEKEDGYSYVHIVCTLSTSLTLVTNLVTGFIDHRNRRSCTIPASGNGRNVEYDQPVDKKAGVLQLH